MLRSSVSAFLVGALLGTVALLPSVFFPTALGLLLSAVVLGLFLVLVPRFLIDDE